MESLSWRAPACQKKVLKHYKWVPVKTSVSFQKGEARREESPSNSIIPIFKSILLQFIVE